MAEEVDSEEPVTKRRRRNRAQQASSKNDQEPVITKEYNTTKKDNKTKSSRPKDESVEGQANGKSGVASPPAQAPHPDKEDEDVPPEGSVSEQEEADASEDDEKPEAVVKARQKVQSTLTSSTADPYPDWKPKEPVPYAALCTTFSLVEMTTKRLIILSLCAQFLRQVLRLTPEDLLPTVQLMVNKLAADYAGIELGIGESLIMKAIGEATGRSLAVIKSDQAEIGDLGLVAAKSRSNQPTMFKPRPLTVRGVHEGLLAIATVSGQGAQTRKVAGIKKLLSAADTQSSSKDKGVDITDNKGGPSEAKFIIRFLEGKLRLGLAEKTVVVALAQAMVAHEAYLKGKVPSTEQLAQGEAILKTVYR